MNHVLSIAKKELRAYFLSPIALIFLGAFLVATLFAFLWVETFFARNIADVRPLFLWLPRLLIFLCAALTMRLWSEEQKLGTLEILLTLPVKTGRLVVGKFVAALVLVAVALALTFHIPIVVSMMGDLDWGPVFGGYAAALLLAAAYLAVGLCVSAITDNQIVALILTCLSCGTLYVIGSDAVTSAVGNRGAEILSALGTGSRFESIRRGVIDIRDVLYYASITIAFLVLNTLVLKAKGWSQGIQTRARRMNMTLLAALVGLNLFALNIWMFKVTAIRLDLTQRKEYTISKVTKDLVRGLPEPLLIRGYISQKTHPLLAPMVPKIRDVLQEYGVVSNGKVRVEFIDPQEDEALEKEANQSYAIKSFKFQFADRHEKAVVNSYFSILVKYGDQFNVINFDDLIEVQATGIGNVEVKLRNMEYDVTRAIQKVAYGFQTLDALFAEMKGDAELKLYVTPKTLPDNIKKAQEIMTKVGNDMKKVSGGKFKFEVVDVDQGGNAMRQDLYQKYGFKPYAVAIFSQESFYFHPQIRVGDKLERMELKESLGEAELKKDIEAALRRGAPGFLKTIGIVKTPDAPMPDPRMPNRPPQAPPDMTRFFTKQLSETYQTKDTDLKDGRVPGDIDVLLVYGPKNLDDKQKFAIDQYLMLGGRVIVLGGKYELDPNAQEGIEVRKVNMGIEDMLASYGVTVQDSMVLDPQNESFPVPRARDLGGIKVQEIQLLPYPFFVDVRSEGMDKDNPVVSSLSGVTLQWASPLSVSTPEKKEGDDAIKREVWTLLKSSDKSWTQTDLNVQPNFDKFKEAGFGPSGDTKSQVLAVAMKGNFESFFKDKPNPVWTGDDKDKDKQGGDRTGRTLKRSPEDARLAVVGSSSFVNDFVLQLSRQTGSDRFMSDIHLLQNLIDWAVEDTGLLTIRSRGTFARTLRTMDAAKKSMFEIGMCAFPFVILGFGILFTLTLRSRMQPLDLDPGRAPKRVKPETPTSPMATSGGAEARP